MGILRLVVDTTNAYVWSILVYILLGAGIYFTIATGFVQIRCFKQSISRMVVGKRKSDSISPFQAFATGIASRVGTGNVAGVAIAIAVGGPGAVFWMWVTALIGMSSAFVESTLGQFFKIRDGNGGYRGGPAYYITQGLNARWAGVIFALCLILAFGFVFNSVQANTIVASLKPWGVNKYIVGAILVIITAPIIFGGIKRVARVAEAVVPFMALIYLILALYIIITNYDKVGSVFMLIVNDAFNFSAAAGGFFGSMFSIGMIQGIKRGLFSNEAGMGSAPNAAAASDASHPVNQGLIQMFGVFVDTIIICSCTAFIILISGIYTNGDLGAELTSHAINTFVGDNFGNYILATVLFVFCFTSIIGNYAYAESNVQFIKNSQITLTVFRVFVLFMVFFGAVQKVALVWDMADASMGLMALVNLISIILLSPIAFILLKDFNKQIRSGSKRPIFDINQYPKLKSRVKDDIWEVK